MKKGMANFLKIALIASAAVGSATAMAAGWEGGVGNVQTLMTKVANMLVYVFFAAGVAAFGFAGKKLWDKGQEGRGDDIKAMHIIWPMVGGAFLMGIAFVAGTTLETLSAGNTTTIAPKLFP